MKAYDRAVNHTLSLKLTIKTPNEQKTGFRWAMLTKDQFNALPLSDKIADDPVKVDTHDDVKTDDTINIPIIESESIDELDDDSSEAELSDSQSDKQQVITALDEPIPDPSVPEQSDEQDEDNIKFDDINDHAAEEAINDDQNDPSDVEDPYPNIDFNNLPDVIRTDDGITRSIGNMVQDIMHIIQNDYNLKQYKLVNINNHIWLNMTLKAKDGKIIFLKKLRVIKDMTKELLEKGFTLPDGSVVHLYWTEATRNKKKRRNVHKDEPPTDNTKKSKKQRRRVKRDMRAKKGHIHMKIFHKKN